MDHLQALGLRPLWIYETLVTTLHDRTPHAAPMGVWTDGSGALVLDAYKGSQTLAGLLESGDFAVNFPADAEVLHRAVLSPEQLTFKAARRVSAPLVTGCTASLELTVSRSVDSGEKVRVTGTVECLIQDGPARLINRAEGLLLESLVLSTRLEYRDRDSVIATLNENLRVVSKVAPGSSYERALAAILRRARASS
jgi:hypothetical protein